MRSDALQYAVRGRVICRYLGFLFLIMAALSVVPLLVSLIFLETSLSIRYVGVLLILGVGGALLSRLEPPSRIQPNEGIVVVTAVFFVSPILMSFPMMSSITNLEDVVFEAISAITTTGLSTLPTVQGMPQTFLFARAWMQWYGGLGLAIFTLALLTQPGLASKGLSVMEGDADDLVGSTKLYAKRIMLAYAALSAIGVVIIMLAGVSLFQSILIAFSAISTGGFSPSDQSLGSFEGAVQFAVILVCVLGAVPLIIYHQIYQKKLERRANLSQAVGLLVLGFITAGVVGMCMIMRESHSLSTIAWNAVFQAFSAQTGAGFSNMDVTSLDAGSKLALIPAMLIGGGIGSTTGGFKIFRLLVFFRLLYLLLIRTTLPKNAILYPTLAKKRLQDQEIQGSLFLIVLFVVVVMVSWLPFLVLGYDPLDSLFEVVSATGTVGLSAGITQLDLPASLKAVLCLDMLLGRLEIFAWVVLVFPGTWFGKRKDE